MTLYPSRRRLLAIGGGSLASLLALRTPTSEAKKIRNHQRKGKPKQKQKKKQPRHHGKGKSLRVTTTRGKDVLVPPKLVDHYFAFEELSDAEKAARFPAEIAAGAIVNLPSALSDTPEVFDVGAESDKSVRKKSRQQRKQSDGSHRKKSQNRQRGGERKQTGNSHH